MSTGENGIKQCSKCREFKDLADFSNDKNRSDGKCLNCRLCESERNKKRYLNDIEHNRKLKKEQALKHRERNHRIHREWYLKNTELRNKQVKEYRLKNPEWYKEYIKQWDKENPEKVKVRQSKFRQTEKGKLCTKHSSGIRGARRRGAEGSYTASEWEKLKKDHNYTCLHCGRKEPEIKLTRDHIIPISKGGNNYLENMQPLCGSCNSKKGNKSEKEVMKCLKDQRFH